MVEQKELLTQGGIYLARLNPSKTSEVGKTRPVIVLTSQEILNISPPVIFICPLSSKSQQQFSNLHFQLIARDNLNVTSYALAEHCRAIAITRIIYPRIAQITHSELSSVIHYLHRIIRI